MSLYTASINSGSNGNCYYIGNGREAVLIDSGLSCRETEKRMKRLGLKMDTLRAIFISHEHGDHIKGAEGLAAKYKLPVYITAATFLHSRLRVDAAQVNTFAPLQPVQIGALSITAFPKKHDAVDPHSFIIRGDGATIGVFTDIGTPCEHVTAHFKLCHAAYLEANYDEQMLENGRYRYPLKKRIHGDFGHLSNRQAVELFLSHGSAQLTHLFLSHISKDNNRLELVKSIFDRHAGNTKIIVATRNEETELYEISDSKGKQFFESKKIDQNVVQISLF